MVLGAIGLWKGVPRTLTILFSEVCHFRFKIVENLLNRRSQRSISSGYIPSFHWDLRLQGSHPAMDIVMDAHPDVLNHNTETVPRLYRQVRLGARYVRSLDMLRYAKQVRPHIPTKSGLMLGLGEIQTEVLNVMRDLRNHDVDILTLGQYLRPSQKHLPILRYVPQQEFDEYKKTGYEMGFAHVEAGPLVRSSYHADSSQENAALHYSCTH